MGNKKREYLSLDPAQLERTIDAKLAALQGLPEEKPNIKGRLKRGLRSDFQLLNQNPFRLDG